MCSPSPTPLGGSAPPVHVLQAMEYSAVHGQHPHLLWEALVWLWNTDGITEQRITGIMLWSGGCCWWLQAWTSAHVVKAGHSVHLSGYTLHRQGEYPLHSWPLPCNQHRCFVLCPVPAVMTKCRHAWQVPPHSSRLMIRTLNCPLSWPPVPCFVSGWRNLAGLLYCGGFDTDLVPFWELCAMNKLIILQLTWWDSLLLLIELDAEGKWGRAAEGRALESQIAGNYWDDWGIESSK